MMHQFIGRRVRCTIEGARTAIEGYFVSIDEGFIVIRQTIEAEPKGPLVAVAQHLVRMITEVSTPKTQ